MATKPESARSRIENITTQLQSIVTSTAKTVTELRELLADSSERVAQKENVRVKSTQLLSIQASTRRKAATNKATITIDVAKQSAISFTSRDRYILATEVANTTLKSLADALKKQPTLPTNTPSKPKTPPRDNSAKPAKSRRGEEALSARSQQPLQERSISQIINSPRKPSSLPKSSPCTSSTTNEPKAGILATAECSRIAFGYLRSPEGLKKAGGDSPSLQLENGMLALIGKLIAHNLDKPAIQELRILKTRLDDFLSPSLEGRERSAAGRKTNGRTKNPQEIDGLASLLDFGVVDFTSAALPLIANYQLYVLRIIAINKRPRTVEAAWNYFKLSYPSSPANLLWHIAKSSAGEAKTIRQIESLAQIILSLCPSISRADDAGPETEHLQPLPDTVLALQHLAFQLRQRWWTLAGHQGNKEKDLLEPFAKCLTTFARRSKLPALKKYKIAGCLFRDLSGSMEDSPSVRLRAARQNPLAAQCLSALAQAAGLEDEALSWCVSSSETTTTTVESAARKAATLVRVATLSFESDRKHGSNTGKGALISSALEALSGSIAGSAADLDILYREVNTMRRRASAELSAAISEKITGNVSPSLSDEALRLVTASMHFYARFISSVLSKNADSNNQNQQKERMDGVAKDLRSIVDSTSVGAKYLMKPELQWTSFNALIADCVSVVQQLDQNSDSDAVGKETTLDASRQPFVRLSNLCWAAYLQGRNKGGTPELLTAALQQSIALLQDRPLAERQVGLLAMKLERSGDDFESQDLIVEARSAFFGCLQNLVESNILQDIVKLAATEATRSIFEEHRIASALGRVLHRYQRTFIKSGLASLDELALFDDPHLAVAERGPLLEYQLSLFPKTLNMSKGHLWLQSLFDTVHSIADILLQLYVPTEYPVRRQRVLSILLQLSQEYPDAFPPTSINSIINDTVANDITKTQDHGLERFDKHLRASVNLQKQLQEANPDLDIIQDCLNSWQFLAESALSRQALRQRVDDIHLLVRHLKLLSDLVAVKGEEYLRLRVLRLHTQLLELERDANPSPSVISLCALALQHLRLGYSSKAGLIFTQAESLLALDSISTEAKLQWYLGYAEYLLVLGNVARCENVLAEAGALAMGDRHFMSLAEPSTALSSRVCFSKTLADAYYIYSLLATHNGRHKDAGKYAKQSVSLYRRVWATLEGRSNTKKASQYETCEPTRECHPNGPFDPLSSMRNDRGVPLVTSMTHEKLNGPGFWHLVPALCRSMMQHSRVFADQGLLQEAVFVSEQAEKVALATDARSLVVENICQRAIFWAESGRPEKAEKLLSSLNPSSHYKHLAMNRYHGAKATLHHSKGEFEEEIRTYKASQTLLESLASPSFIATLDLPPSSVESLVQKISAMDLEANPVNKKNPTRPGRGRKPTTRPVVKPTQKALVPAVATAPRMTEECLPLHKLRVDTMHRRILAHLDLDDVSSAQKLLDGPLDPVDSANPRSPQLWVTFKTKFAKSMMELAQDINLNTLLESTTAFPAIVTKDRTLSEVSVSRKPNPSLVATTKGVRAKNPVKGDILASLNDARNHLIEAHSLCTQAGSNYTFQQASNTLSNLTVLLSAIPHNVRGSLLHPLHAACLSENAKHFSLKMSQEVVELEQERSNRESLLKWPQVVADREFALPSAPDFQKEYIDIIPDTWTAVSLSLSDSRDELFATRYEAGYSPFMLRIPLSRHASRDMDEDEFGFDEGRKDLEEIIELSDINTHSAKDMNTKEAKAGWWEERYALDERLRGLLINMENIWLGGCKGIFSQHPRQPALLARFRKSFENILTQHLPSRRGKTKQKRPVLDSRILELFIGLGDATSAGLDLDEPLLDLIHLVMDILQFNGEANAFDEIDFDAIAVETLDALRAYHQASEAQSRPMHTILILDKNLHLFPWESMSCLRQLPISRLPSLAALRERLLALRPSESSEDAPLGHYIRAATGGTSILNPSGDLIHTEEVMRPKLNDLEGEWNHIISRAPSEKEFESALRDNELVFYHGHGSGAQFIRSKTVRQLYAGRQAEHKQKPGCATTFLFGCSSAHLTENGIYEPSGMLANYLVAGAPAVVGMLWDVTDKDCDRLASKAGELWGLWPGTKAEVIIKSAKKPKGRGKVARLIKEVEGGRGSCQSKRSQDMQDESNDTDRAAAADERHRGLGLDEAIRDARDACLMKYLNGAAAVVYGIPVYLE
ncbi:hypothetical protein EJ04DRAFT_453801 [Polyplosphaeria fusca]|uniref:separase n=1 Tax=Polyplosphaeria fusca TaxID=682080 RepID=A0A9P4RC29_9PLEO|nr:hypothetical protein EJ04DRAFT_453801 [Polyplosphaeria fusca]